MACQMPPATVSGWARSCLWNAWYMSSCCRNDPQSQKIAQSTTPTREPRTRLFCNKKVLELGSGKGATLIAVGLARTRRTNHDDEDEYKGLTEILVPHSVLTLTDNDMNVLSLCKLNCDRNLHDHQGSLDYKVGRLDWGSSTGTRATQEIVTSLTTTKGIPFSFMSMG